MKKKSVIVELNLDMRSTPCSGLDYTVRCLASQDENGLICEALFKQDFYVLTSMPISAFRAITTTTFASVIHFKILPKFTLIFPVITAG